MGYSKIQKFISGLLIFSLLFTLTFRVSFEGFLNQVFASDTNTYNIVAIVVDDSLYDTSIFSSDIKKEIERYAKDVQNALPMTKAIILPTKSQENPYNIASLLEKLYFEGYKGINGLTGDSKLVGSVFVGNIPLPIINKGNEYIKSVVPYTDFEDKAYIYNPNTKKYEKNSSSKSSLKSEIWHSFISPNTGNSSDDIKQLKNFFDKDHDFYQKEGNFSKDKLVDNKPYVFYFDQIRESKAINLQNYNAYINFLLNLEDISYNRFSKYLAAKLTNSYLGESSNDIKNMIESLGLDFDTSYFSNNGPDLTNAPDISTKDVISKTIKRFVEIFNESSLGDMKKFVYNAGRYNGTGTTVSVDMAPYLITQLDEISRIIVKDANNSLESIIDNLVKNGLSRNLAIPTEIKDSLNYNVSDYCNNTYTNIFYGKQASSITNAADCSVYRGSNTNSGTLVEANRGLNVTEKVQADINFLKGESSSCVNQTSGRFGGNSPINLNQNSISSGNLELGNHDLTKSITPILDLGGAKKISDNSKTPSPLNCLTNNFIVTEKQSYNNYLSSNKSDGICDISYRVPINGQSRVNWSCSSVNQNYSYSKTFNDLYKETYNSCINNDKDTNEFCNLVPKCNGLSCYDGDKSLPNGKLALNINFKKISSYIEHKSPNSDELSAQVKSMTAPNLPIDKDRYIDFVNAKGNYDKINYPYLYRLTDLSSDITIASVKQALKTYLDQKSNEINAKISAGNPGSLSGKDKELYDLLKTGSYPTQNIDLYKTLESKATQTLNIAGDTKKLSYLDTLVFSLYWTKLNSPGAKYKFVFENYLQDQFKNNNIDFPLPGNKKMYEISYLASSGDAKNMYVSMDPEKNATNPYASIIAANLALNNNLLSTNIGGKKNNSEDENCGPPEGVPLRKWIPAVMCRIKSLLPPKIAINPGSCSSTTIGMSEQDQSSLASCNKDENKNGIIDCQENISSINLVSDSKKYSYNTTGTLEAQILDGNGNLMNYDNFSNIGLELVRVDVARDETKDFSDTNKKTIYNKEAIFGSELNNSLVLANLKNYLNFKDIKVKASYGKARISFSTKDKDIDLYFRASLVAKDSTNQIAINLKSNDLPINVRGSYLNVSTHNVSKNSISDGSAGVKASDKQNIFIIDGNNTDISSIKSVINQASTASEKYVLNLKNFSKNNIKISLSYPIRVDLLKNDVLINSSIIAPLGNSYKGLFSIKEAGTYKLVLQDNSGAKIAKEIQVNPDFPSDLRLDLSTNITNVGGVLTNHLVSLYDNYGNLVSGNLYSLNLSVAGDSMSFDDGTKKKTINTFEGYKAFKLKSTDSSGEREIKVNLDDSINDIHLEKKGYIRSLDGVTGKVDIENENAIKVGGNKYKYKISINDGNGVLLSGFNSKAYLSIPSIYGTTDNSILTIKNGVGEGTFTTSTLASKSVNLSFSVEGLKNTITKSIIIHPEKPIKLDMTLGSSKIEASTDSNTSLGVELKDRYGNLVFDDNQTMLKLEIPDEYKHIINSNESQKSVVGGKANFTLTATPNPGIAYLKVSSTPSLSSNSFSIVGQSPFLKTSLNNSIFKNSSGLTDIGNKFFYEVDSIHYRSKYNSLSLLQASSDFKTLSQTWQDYLVNTFNSVNNIVINGVGENAVQIETYYFWNKSKIDGNGYNSLYTALLGANYGDITQKDYLAGALLFDRDNRALAVSSLLNNPSNITNLVSLSPTGNISIAQTDDLSQDISVSYANYSKHLSFDIYNNSLNTLIGKVYFKANNNILPVCEKDNLDDCYSEANGIFIKKEKDSLYDVANQDDKIIIKDSAGNTSFSISKDMQIENNAGFTINLNTQNKKDYLVLDLEQDGNLVANIGIKLNNLKIDVSRDEALFQNKISTFSDGIFLFMQSNTYALNNVYSGNSTNANPGIGIWYNDLTGLSKSLSALDNESNSFSNFSSKAGIGWEGENKSMLLFAGGDSVGDSTKDYQSLSFINLGDPVVSLEKQDKYIPGTSKIRKFDSSIGKLLGTGVKSYAVFDYNNDKIDDIVYLDDKGYIKLLEGTQNAKEFIDKGNLFYLSDIDDKYPILAGDFTGDSFDDIFFVNTDGKPVLLNNDKKHFTRIDLYREFSLAGRISKIAGFDMNNDKKYDIVSLDDNGDINIFYGGGTSSSPNFTKNKIDSGYAIKLDSNPRTDNAAIYFNGLYQLSTDSQADFLANSEKLQASIKSFNESIKRDPSLEQSLSPSKTEFNEGIIDKLLFYQFNYDPEYSNYELSQTQAQNNIISSMPASYGNDEISSSMNDAKNSISNFFSDASSLNPNGIVYNSGITNTNKITTFLRSEYAPVENISVTKTYTDKNGGYLRSGDKVSVKVEIKNNRNSLLKNLAYLDKVPDPFSLGDSTLYKFKLGKDYKSISPKSRPDGSDFSFMIDHFDLQSGQTAVFEYELDTLPFTYGDLQAGLFEKGELGDDSYGDIILKNNSKNCGEANRIYRSISQTTYEKGEKEPECSDSKSKLPDEAQKNLTDTDGNGVPDYIDKLKANGGNNTDFTNYASSKTNYLNFDKDLDGIPDINDINPDYNEDDGSILDGLNDFTAKASSTLDGVENFINGLGCGFGNASCIASPLNWAPLASGSDPTLFGCPIGDGLSVGEGIPVFSMFTGMPLYGPGGCFPVPSVWPPMPFDSLRACKGGLGAGGRLGTLNPLNVFRLYVTPTITGGIGIEACFGGPAIIAGNSLPKGISPIVPGGNCIVTAVKSNMCRDDGSDGDVGSTGYSQVSGAGYNVINANCSDSTGNSKATPYMDPKKVADYINYKRTGQKSDSLASDMQAYLSSVQNSSSSWTSSNSPLIQIGSNNSSSDNMELGLSIDTNAIKNGGSFSDILKIDLKRIFPFPDFLMEWWTRQIEEIVTKLTDWPTIYVILPDFSGMLNSGWKDFLTNIQNKFNSGTASQASKNSMLDKQISNLDSKYKCSDDDNVCKTQKSLEKATLEAKKYQNGGEVMSGIRQVYEFLGNLPLISLDTQTIDINIPWIDSSSISKAIVDFETTKKQWQQEIDDKKKMWTAGLAGCDGDKACEAKYSAANNISVNASSLVSSIDQNIEALKDYKKMPEKINKLITIKETRLSQILCNIETISMIMGGRLGDNGKRFKAWIELYILVKSILKSWQLILDIFYDYDASCHDCKNERSDLMYCIFKIISMIIPKIPVVQFPKWPDIVVDLHNIRANLSISLPDFQFNLRPILIPTLPHLYLPETPSVNINLPSLPVLPTINLPTLPDLPTLPTVTLPNLPPPPTLPKLFAGIEAILNILKLITKIMCILKKNPFVPEWRAGDQISFLTERSGYLPTDFLSVSLPQFSYPFVDAIKVTSYVNLEFEADFISEFARNMVMPLNTFTSNIVNMFNASIPDLDFRGMTPQNIDVNLGGSNNSINIDGKKLNYKPSKGINLLDFSSLLRANISAGISYVIKNKDATVSNADFKKLISDNLSKNSVVSDPKTASLRDLWAETNSYNFSKEDKLISDLLKNNKEKFDTLKSIINTEIKETKKLKENFKNNKLSIAGKNKLVSSNISRFDSYKSSLEGFNDKTMSSLVSLVNYDYSEKNTLKTEGQKVIDGVKSGTDSLTNKLKDSETRYNSMLQSAKNNLLADTATGTVLSNSGTTNSCKTGTAKTGTTGTYSYKGLYIIEDGTSYKLFDYQDELTGDETTKTIKIANSDSTNLLYQVGGELYLKTDNTDTTKAIHYDGNPIIVNIDDNKFYSDSSNTYSSVNNFSESVVDSNNINLSFTQPKGDLSNFRVEFFNIVDKFSNLDNTKAWNGPNDTRKQIIDAFADIDNRTINTQNNDYTIRKNLAYMDYYSLGNNISMSTKELVNIKDKLQNNTILNISTDTKIYAGANDVKLFYHIKDDNSRYSIVLSKYKNISFAYPVTIFGIEGDAYLASNNSKIYSSVDMTKLIGLPILPGTQIKSTSQSNNLSHVDINYYDGTNTSILFKDVSSYSLYDLGNYSDSYILRTFVPNDFYYAKISSFKDGIFSTNSNQSLLSPQVQADNVAPELTLNSTIKVAVYIGKTIDLTDMISENGGISNLKEVYIDSNLMLDSDGDGKTDNDKDNIVLNGKNLANIEVQLSLTSLKLNILPFDNIFTKKIRIYLVDKNNNTGYKDVNLQVYAPIPEIKQANSGNISGVLNENLQNEKVDLYRYRGGVLKRLTKDSVFTNFDAGAFSYKANIDKGLVLKTQSGTIANIDETTGKIDLQDKKYNLQVIPANKSINGYTNIEINNGNTNIYYEYLITPNVGNVKTVDDFSGIQALGTYFKMTNKSRYSYFLLPNDIPNNPGDLIVYDVTDLNKTPIFEISRDGKINLNRTDFSIEYDSFDNRPVYKLLNPDKVEIARIMLVTEGNYIMK